jgi:hypothetical protein
LVRICGISEREQVKLGRTIDQLGSGLQHVVRTLAARWAELAPSEVLNLLSFLYKSTNTDAPPDVPNLLALLGKTYKY